MQKVQDLLGELYMGIFWDLCLVPLVSSYPEADDLHDMEGTLLSHYFYFHQFNPLLIPSHFYAFRGADTNSGSSIKRFLVGINRDY